MPFVVLKVQCETQQLWVADAAGPPNPGVATRQLDMSQQGPHSPPRTYLFYRLLYPQLGATLAHIAAAWSAQHVRNFSRLRCTLAPFHHRAMSRNTRARLQHFAHYAAHPAPVPALRGRGYYRFMCSEFVSTVGAVAVMTLGRVAQRPPGADFALLRGGPGWARFRLRRTGHGPVRLTGAPGPRCKCSCGGLCSRLQHREDCTIPLPAPLPTLRALAKTPRRGSNRLASPGGQKKTQGLRIKGSAARSRQAVLG